MENSFSFTFSFFDVYVCREMDLRVTVLVSSTDEVTFNKVKSQFSKYFIEYYNNKSITEKTRFEKIQGNNAGAAKYAMEKIGVNANASVLMNYTEESQKIIREQTIKDAKSYKDGEKSEECKIPENIILTTEGVKYSDSSNGSNGSNMTPFIIGGAALLVVIVIICVLMKKKK